MKRSYVAAVVMFVSLVARGTSAKAQSADAVVVTVPFEFVAGGATLKGGDYRIGRISSSTNDELAISGYNNSGTFLRPLMFDEAPSDSPALSFVHVGGKYFLRKITTFRGVYTLLPQREMNVLGEMKAPDALSSSGTN